MFVGVATPPAVLRVDLPDGVCTDARAPIVDLFSYELHVNLRHNLRVFRPWNDFCVVTIVHRATKIARMLELNA